MLLTKVARTWNEVEKVMSLLHYDGFMNDVENVYSIIYLKIYNHNYYENEEFIVISIYLISLFIPVKCNQRKHKKCTYVYYKEYVAQFGCEIQNNYNTVIISPIKTYFTKTVNFMKCACYMKMPIKCKKKYRNLFLVFYKFEKGKH